MTDRWYVAYNGVQHGPLTRAALQQWRSEGRFAPTDLVWRSGVAAWTRADSVPGLFPKPILLADVVGDFGSRLCAAVTQWRSVLKPEEWMETLRTLAARLDREWGSAIRRWTEPPALLPSFSSPKAVANRTRLTADGRLLPLPRAPEDRPLRGEWYYVQDGQQFGPFSEADLPVLADHGELRADAQLWQVGLPSWVSAAEVLGQLRFTWPPGELPPEPPALPDSPLAGSQPCCMTEPVTHMGTSHAIISGTDSPRATLTNPLTWLNSPVIAGIHRQRLVILLLAGLGVLATFLPEVYVSRAGTIIGIAGNSWITFGLFLPAVGLALRGDTVEPLYGGARLRASIPAGLASLIAAGKWLYFELGLGQAWGNQPPIVSIGIGLYGVIAAGSALVAVAGLLDEPALEADPLDDPYRRPVIRHR